MIAVLMIMDVMVPRRGGGATLASHAADVAIVGFCVLALEGLRPRHRRLAMGHLFDEGHGTSSFQVASGSSKSIAC
jgi:hypothetical protein